MKKKALVLLAILFAIFFLNTFHEKYPDEFDSIVGGRYITEGRLPYRDWFQHHQPGAYLAAATLLPFTGLSFVRFRIALAVFFFALHVAGYFMLRKRMPRADTGFYLFTLFLIALAGTYFWGHMLLADTLSSYLLLPAYALLMMRFMTERKINERDIAIITLLTFFTWFTSMTLTYVVVGINVFAIAVYAAGGWPDKKDVLQRVLRAGAIALAPYILFLLYLVATGSLKDYYFANITYNQEYYIYNYPRVPGRPINPLRYAIIIANTFFNNYVPALAGVVGFPFSDPLQVTLALGSAALGIMVVVLGRWELLIPLLVVLVFTNARSNPQSIKETDYQAASYIVTSLFNGTFAFALAQQTVDSVKSRLSSRIIASAIMLLVGVYFVFTLFFLFLKFSHKFYPKYMGTAPLIYDAPQVAPILNSVATKDDYVWIGPFEFEELLYLRTKSLPSKYHWFLNHAATSKIKDEIVADLTQTRPKFIVFDRGFAPWGGDASTYNFFFTDFLDANYVRLFKLNDVSTDVDYRWTLANTQNFDWDGDVNIDKNRRDEIIRQLLDKGYIEEVPSQ